MDENGRPAQPQLPGTWLPSRRCLVCFSGRARKQGLDQWRARRHHQRPTLIPHMHAWAPRYLTVAPVPYCMYRIEMARHSHQDQLGKSVRLFIPVQIASQHRSSFCEAPIRPTSACAMTSSDTPPAMLCRQLGQVSNVAGLGNPVRGLRLDWNRHKRSTSL